MHCFALFPVLVRGAVLNAILVGVVVPVLLPVVVWLLFSRYELLVVPVPGPPVSSSYIQTYADADADP